MSPQIPALHELLISEIGSNIIRSSSSGELEEDDEGLEKRDFQLMIRAVDQKQQLR